MFGQCSWLIRYKSITYAMWNYNPRDVLGPNQATPPASDMNHYPICLYHRILASTWNSCTCPMAPEARENNLLGINVQKKKS